MSDEDQPPRRGAEGRWWPYTVPEDVSDAALGTMRAAELVLAFQDTTTVVQRAAVAETEDHADFVVAEVFEALVDTRDRIGREIHRRLLEVDHQAEYRERLALKLPRPRHAA